MPSKAKIDDKIVVNTRTNLKESEKWREKQSSTVTLRVFLNTAHPGFSLGRQTSEGKKSRT